MSDSFSNEATTLQMAPSSASFKIELGMTYITSDQSVVKIVAERRVLNQDGTITELWEGDDQVQYSSDGKNNTSTVGQPNLVICLGPKVDSLLISEALGYVRKAEDILREFRMEVIVRRMREVSDATSLLSQNR